MGSRKIMFLVPCAFAIACTLSRPRVAVVGPNGASDRTPAAEKNFGGPFGFGIPFSSIDNQVVSDFWGAIENPQSFTHTINKEDLVHGDESSLVDTNPMSPVIKFAIAQYVSQMAPWVKGHCAEIDMNLLMKGTLKFRRAIRVLPHGLFALSEAGPDDFKKLQAKYTSLEAFWKDSGPMRENEPMVSCVFEKKPYGGESPDNPTFDADLLASDDWSLVADPNRVFVTGRAGGYSLDAYAGLSAQNLKTGETWYGTRYASIDPSTRTEGENGPISGPVAIAFKVIDNFLIPDRSFNISKGLTVPIARFDRTTGQITNYYDFGMLLLKYLEPQKFVYLTTVVSADKAQNYGAKHDLGHIGTFAGKTDKVDTYVPWGNFPLITPFAMYDRLPIGSVHFMINAFWVDAAAQSGNSAIISQIAVADLIAAYLSNNAWINTYDYIRNLKDDAFAVKHHLPTDTVKKIADGGCDQFLPANLPSGMWLSHEIILSHAAAMKLAFTGANSTAVIKGCGHRVK